MRIIEGWSHGYLQMYQLIPEVKVAIQHLAAWMEEVFASADLRRAQEVNTKKSQSRKASRSRSTSRTRRRMATRASETETDDLLTFTPRKKRSPRNSSESEDEDRGRTRRSSSGETVVTSGGPRTPPDSSELLQVPKRRSPPLNHQGTRTGTPLFAPQSKNPPLSEAEMMKRRREEAVLGLVAEQVVDVPASHGRAGSW